MQKLQLAVWKPPPVILWTDASKEVCLHAACYNHANPHPNNRLGSNTEHRLTKRHHVFSLTFSEYTYNDDYIWPHNCTTPWHLDQKFEKFPSAPFEFPDTLCLAPFVRHFRKNFVRSYHWSVLGISTESFLLLPQNSAREHGRPPAELNGNIPFIPLKHSETFLWTIFEWKTQEAETTTSFNKKRDVLSHAKQDTGSPLWVLCCKCSLHRLFGNLDKALFVLIISVRHVLQILHCFFFFFYRRTAPASADALQQSWMEKDETFFWTICECENQEAETTTLLHGPNARCKGVLLIILMLLSMKVAPLRGEQLLVP